MKKEEISVERVFGITNEYIDSYIDRPKVDELFIRGLKSNKHIIVYGSSKQGKSSLIRQHVLDEMKVVVDCTPKSSLIDIYKSILRQLNVELEESITIEKNKQLSTSIGATFKLKIPFFGSGEANTNLSADIQKGESKNYKYIESNLALAQD